MSIRPRTWGKNNEKSGWVVDYRDNAGNRRCKQFSRKKDAQAWQTGAAWQVSQGIHTADSQSITIAEAVDLWLNYADCEGLERSTVTSYEATSRLHIIPFLGKMKLSKLTRPIIESYKDELLQTRSRAMAQRAIRYLVQVINEAMRRGLTAFNAAKGVSIKQHRREKAVIPSKDELLAIIAVCGVEERAFFLTAIFAGLRSSELRGLTWSNINFDAKTLSVTQKVDAWNKIGPPKSNAGRRAIPLPERTIKALREWKLACPPSSLQLVFPTKSGTPQSYSNLMKRKIVPTLIDAGITKACRDKYNHIKLDKQGDPLLTGKYTLHAFRHAAASIWIDQNIDIKRLQTWMGHENIQITIDTYGHLMKDSDKDAAYAAAAENQMFSHGSSGQLKNI